MLNLVLKLGVMSLLLSSYQLHGLRGQSMTLEALRSATGVAQQV